jgi:uncharacterized protein (TIGR02996 family)
MSDTLEALHRAVIANPQDRTVRLVYADALDETGDRVHVARAEFIRAQIELESVPEPHRRHYELAVQCRELFDEHWLTWWAAVAEAAKLPYPHVPGKRVRDRIARAVGRQRVPKNWPYTHTSSHGNIGVHLADYGLSFRFAGGFPEEVRFMHFDVPEGGPALVHRWGDEIPLVRLSFAPLLDAAQWERVNGPHLVRLSDLTFDQLLADTARRVAESPHLTALARLAVNPFASDADAIRALVASPSWAGLRVLQFNGRMSPDGVRDLARYCSLEHLEELDLTLGNPGPLGSPLAEAAFQILRMMARAVAFPTADPPRWVEFGPALEALAAAPWVRRLRVLRIQSGHAGGLLGLLHLPRLYGGTESGADVIPDAAVLALASAVSTDKLERLVLPAAAVGPSVKEELTTRLGGRVMFTEW